MDNNTNSNRKVSKNISLFITVLLLVEPLLFSCSPSKNTDQAHQPSLANVPAVPGAKDRNSISSAELESLLTRKVRTASGTELESAINEKARTFGVSSKEILKAIEEGRLKTKPGTALVRKGDPQYNDLLNFAPELQIVQKYKGTLSPSDTTGKKEAQEIIKNLSKVAEIIKNSDVIYQMGASGAMYTKIGSETYGLGIMGFIAVNSTTGKSYLIILYGAKPIIKDITPEVKKLMHGGKITEQQIRQIASAHDADFNMHEAVKQFYPPEQVENGEGE
jgi:hypothetical protein